ncbi:hypothetical protein VaNZ11_008106 [Volvox africanus]|uniref:GPI transamidase component PIG-S n=1 Tax=Volvox africanus TaxID=51714 RepID=A0ABQ5S4M3_9CHLO|nr:hypothetical protein VaNZ11_008106 [Volvox africanus]
MGRSVANIRDSGPVDAHPGPAKRRFWSVATLGAYIFCIALPLTYNAVRVPRVALPHSEIDRLSAALADPVAAALPSTITAYLVCPGHGYSCLEHQQLSGYAEQLGLAVLMEAGLNPEQAPLMIRVLLDAPGRCSASSWIPPGQASRRAANKRPSAAAAASGGGGGSSCLDLVTSPDLHRVVTGGQDRDFDDWAAAQLAGQDRPGNYHVFVVPDPWLAASELPYGSVGRRRMAFVRHPAAHAPTHGSVIRLIALLAAPAFATELGAPSAVGGGAAGPSYEADPDAGQPLPVSAAAQLHLSFSLCNAHPSPGGGPHDAGVSGQGAGGARASSAFTWRFSEFESQFVTPLKQVLSPAARVTVSSQVLYFTPGRVNGTWDARQGAFVLPYNQLPFFVDSSWPLDPGRTGLPASAATSANPSAAAPAVGSVSLLSALRTGLAPWEVDALVRRRVREDAVGAASTLAALTRLVREVPTMVVPGHVGTRVRDAVGALQRALQFAVQGLYEEASRAAQEARSWAEAAFSDPALSSRLSVPDAHLIGVYLPFCLPAALPLFQTLLQEVRKRRGRRRGEVAVTVQDRDGTCKCGTSSSS